MIAYIRGGWGGGSKWWVTTYIPNRMTWQGYEVERYHRAPQGPRELIDEEDNDQSLMTEYDLCPGNCHLEKQTWLSIATFSV